MTKIAYLECPTGIAGDMCLAALVHAGVPLEYLSEQLERLSISHEYTLRAEIVRRNGQAATKVHVELHHLPDPDYAAQVEPGVDPHPTFRHHLPVLGTVATDKGELGKGELATSQLGELVDLHRSSASADGSLSDHEQAGSDRSQPHPFPKYEYPHPLEHPHEHTQGHTQGHELHPSAVDLSHLPAEVSTHADRHLPEIEHLIKSARFSTRAEAWSLAVFRQLAVAEGAVHGIPPEAVHFHEVGATDAIVDVVGTCLGLDWLGIDQLYCSALPTGGGTVWAAHGRLPVPTPAVLKLWELRQVPVYSNGIDRELVTPTGAAIATTLATQFGAPPPMTLHRVGLGAGSRDLPIPNILRLWIGESSVNPPSDFLRRSALATPQSSDLNSLGRDLPASQPSPPSRTPATEPIAVLETQIDDANPQAIAYAFDRLFEAGAVDVFTQPVMMKKSRLGTLLTVICHPAQANSCERVLFQETSTLGVRRSLQQRTALHREMISVNTAHGAVRVKIARAQPDGEILNAQPEYEDCAKIAYTVHLPWQDIHRLALEKWHTEYAQDNYFKTTTQA